MREKKEDVKNWLLALYAVAEEEKNTVWSISELLEMDTAYAHRLTSELIKEGYLVKSDPKSKGRIKKPIRLTPIGFQKLISVLSLEMKDNQHSEYLDQVTNYLHDVFIQNQHQMEGFEIYLRFFDKCKEELFRPDYTEDVEHQELRWRVTLFELISILKETIDFGQKVSDGTSKALERMANTLSPGWQKDDYQYRGFGVDLFFTFQKHLWFFEGLTSASNNKYTILPFFHNEIIPMFKPYKENITDIINIQQVRLNEVSRLNDKIDEM
ncbi:DNA-binding MarR family transcriptional regulator [Methanocalculus sp. AMF5]|uniref:hypothetical protein n=1 Tax=Methanocalculus sp. AMF5 TaxID=1198257 RepID=UPI00209EEC4B|nr:hypothetical protein [Methanocalculus sp. AMF5]MCP1661868.1 DNA-binding MarR family transcriptional regulator [Methanocalculus sp. AMF5]